MAVTVTRTDSSGKTYTYDVKDQGAADLHKQLYGASVVQQPAVTANSQGQVTSNAGSTPVTGGGTPTAGGTGSTSLTSGTGQPAYTPNPIAPNLNQSQLTYFDNKYGGINNYVQNQQQRYDQAKADNDYGLLSGLSNDAKRVGYMLDDSKYSQNKQNLQPDYSWIDQFVNNELDQQKLALDQLLDRHRGDAQNSVDQNNMFLQEQLGRLDEQKKLTGQDIINFQNRRGGFYSGGVDYQTANNEKAYTQASSDLTRDIESRNSAIWSNYNQLASQAAEKLSLLQQQAPDRIRQLIQEQMSIDANFTGNYNGQRTIAGQTLDLARENQSFNQNMDVNKFLYGQSRDQRRDYESDRLFEYGVYRDNVGDAQWKQQFEKSTQQFAQQMGYNWASLDQRERQFMAELTIKEADRQFQQAQVQFGQGMDVFKQTGQMPSFMSQYGVDVKAMNDAAVKDDLTAMYTLLGQGVAAKDLIKAIDDKIKMGIESRENGEKLKQALYSLYPNLDPSKPSEPKKSTFSLDNTWVGPSLTDIDKATGLSKFAKWWNESVLGIKR